MAICIINQNVQDVFSRDSSLKSIKVATAIQLYIPTCQANNEKKSALKARETASRKEIDSYGEYENGYEDIDGDGYV